MTDKQKVRLQESAQTLVAFCELNGIPKPKVKIYHSRNDECGYYQYHSKVIHIDPDACAREVKNPAMRCWSHPHYFTDRTVYGVLHHEFGHYLHEYLKFPKLPKGKQITSYEPNKDERFAESIKLFISNPMLLKEYNPERYAALIALGLKPLHQKPWQQVMAEDGMSDRFIKRAKEKIAY